MKKTNKPLDLGVAIIHEMDGVSYKISGRLIDINESASTCTIRFKNGRVEKNIDMSKVYIAEGLIDTVKKYGKKFASWVIEKVKGFVAFVNDLGERQMWNPINMLIAYDKEQPAGVGFAPGNSLVEAASEAGVTVSSMSVDEAFLEAENHDIAEINKYWTRVMNRVGTSDESVEESVKWVNENYYRGVNRNSSNVNEAQFTIGDVPNAVGKEMYGRVVNTPTLKGLIRQNIVAQLSLDKKYRAERIAAKRGVSVDKIQTDLKSADEVRPLLIWGAPGIGKTAIVKSVLKDLRNSKYHSNLNIQVVNCSSIDKSTFILPKKAEADDMSFEICPLKWLPFYAPGSAKHNEEMEEYYAKCRHLVNVAVDGVEIDYNEAEDYTGGVVFLDEVARASDEGSGPGVANVLMGLVDGKLQQLRKAKSWCFIGASNRHIDDGNQDTQSMTSGPYIRRWTHITFVPSKQEWIDWAESIDTDEGSETQGLAKIPKVITDFIKASSDGVWYSAISFGAFDEELKAAIAASGSGHEISDYTNGTIAAYKLFDEFDEDVNLLLGNDKIAWNPARWHEVAIKYNECIQQLLEDVEDGYTFEDLRQQTIENGETDINPTLLAPALEKVDPDTWADFVTVYLPDNPDKIKHKTGSSRLQDLYDALVGMCATQFGSEDVLPVRNMREHFKWTSIFDDRVCASIFATGQMPQPEAKQDDLGVKAGGFEWKKDSYTIPKVVEHIITKYPNGEGHADFAAYVDSVANSVADCGDTIDTLLYKKNTSSSAAEIQKAITNTFDLSRKCDEKKLQEFFTVHTNTDEYGDVQILDVASYSDLGKEILYNVVFGNRFYQNIINYVKYLTKVGYSIAASGRPGFGFYGTLANSDKGNIRTLILNTCGIKNDQQLMRQYNNMQNKLGELRTKNKTSNYAEISNLTECVDVFVLIARIMYNVINNDAKSTFKGKKAAKK